MTKELLPCPFCGGEAQYSEESRFHICWVYCPDCGAASGCRSTEAEAIAAWNTRAERTCKAYMHSGFLKDEPNAIEFSCGHFCLWPDEIPPKYCPDCGAKVVER